MATRVLYHPFVLKGAVGLIEHGFASGFAEAGAEVLVWDGDSNTPEFIQALASFRPTHFVGHMQTVARTNSVWMAEPIRAVLLEYKKRTGLRVAACSAPGNLAEYFGDWLTNATVHKQAGVASFYGQPPRPNAVEREALADGLIDLVTTRWSIGAVPGAYRNFLELGTPVLVQPQAAEARYYDSVPVVEQDIDLLYIGNCWSFKWENMRQYVQPLKERFGNGFQIYGSGWPEGISLGPLDDGRLSEMAARARINLGLHEPSQVLVDRPASANERVFKLLSMGAFVISDPCAAFQSFFREGEHLVIARSGAEMVALAETMLAQPERRRAIAKQGRQHVMKCHTYRQRAERLLSVLSGTPVGIYDFAA